MGIKGKDRSERQVREQEKEAHPEQHEDVYGDIHINRDLEELEGDADAPGKEAAPGKKGSNDNHRRGEEP
jgi:hypothetical protein